MIGFVTQKGELTLAEVSFMGKEINMSSGVNSTGQTYALDMQKVSKRFPGTLAVDKVDFRVKKGEVHALMGENGAGKSTLMKMLNGLFNDYTGDIYINGEKKLLHSPDNGQGKQESEWYIRSFLLQEEFPFMRIFWWEDFLRKVFL